MIKLLPMDIIKKIKCNPIHLDEKINFLIDKSREMRLKVISKPIDNTTKIKLLVDDTFIFNIYTMITHVFSLKDSENNAYVDILKKINQYNIEFNTDISLLNVIIELYKGTKNVDEKFFLQRLLKSMEKYGTCNESHKKILEIFTNLNSIEEQIIEILDKPTSIKIDRKNIDAKSESIMSSVYPDKKNNIYIDKARYYYLIKKISDKPTRIYIENQYIQRYYKLNQALNRLLISRKVYTELLGYDSFYLMVSNKSAEDTENIKLMLRDLNEKLDINLGQSLEELKSLSKTDRLRLNDIVYGLDRLYPEIKFKPIDIIQLILNVLQTKFKIRCKQSGIKSPIDNTSLIELSSTDGTLKGYLILDLLNANRKIKAPQLIKISNNYGTNVAVLYLTAPYTNLDKSILNLSDVVVLFREFGMVIYNIFSLTPFGVSDDDIEIINFLPDVMEFILFNQSILNMFIPDKNIIKKILHVRYFELLINLKLKCLSVLFDNIIHSSDEFYGLLKKSSNEHICADLYKKIFIDLFGKFSSSIDITNININPNAILNIIEGQQGLIFGNLISNILAFTAANFIMKSSKLDLFYDFLQNKNYSYKKNLIKFISSIEEDYYNVFLAKCLKIKNIHVESYFDVETEAN